jgi:hypothetical protein
MTMMPTVWGTDDNDAYGSKQEGPSGDKKLRNLELKNQPIANVTNSNQHHILQATAINTIAKDALIFAT